jgi:hypothetical protein
VTEVWDEGFKEDPCLVPKNIWIAVCGCDKNAASALPHLMKMVIKGHSHYLATQSQISKGHGY